MGMVRRTARRTARRSSTTQQQQQVQQQGNKQQEELNIVKPTYQDDVVHKEARNSKNKSNKNNTSKNSNSNNNEKEDIIRDKVSLEIVQNISQALEKRGYEKETIEEIKFVIAETILK